MVAVGCFGDEKGNVGREGRRGEVVRFNGIVAEAAGDGVSEIGGGDWLFGGTIDVN